MAHRVRNERPTWAFLAQRALRDRVDHGVLDHGDERFGPVWRRLRRLDIEGRNLTAFVDLGADGRVGIACSGADHAASVAGSELVLHDHDVTAELALLALGGALPSCLVYAAVWREGLRSERFLRGWADDVEGDLVRAAREDWI